METIFKKKFKNILGVLFCCAIVLGILKIPVYVLAEESINSNVIYVKNGNEQSQVGDGTSTNPYESLKYAISKANDGDTIKLVEKIVFRNPGMFEINKAVTIDGQNNILNFIGADIGLGKNVEFKNLDLKMIHETNRVPVIYVGGHELRINNVSTKISDIQNDVRPMIVAGDKDGNPSGTYAKINISGGSSQTRFNKILVGNETGDLYIPVDININSEYAVVDNGIILGKDDNSQVLGKVTVTSNSKGIKKIDGTHSIDNEVILKDSKFYNLSLDNIVNLTLSNNAEFTVGSEKAFLGTMDLKENTKLFVTGNKQFNIGLLKGSGMIILNPDSLLNVKKMIQDTVHIKLIATEDKLLDKLNRVYVKAEEGIAEGILASIDPLSDNYFLERSGKTYVLSEHETTYTVRIAEPISNGKVIADRMDNIKEGDVVTLTIIADEGYELKKLTVNDSVANPITVDAGNTFIMPASNVNVYVTFKKKVDNQQHIVRFFDGDAEYTVVKVERGKSIDNDGLNDQSMPNHPMKEGYTFKEWNTQKSGKGAKFTGATVVNEDKSIYAVYSLNQATIEIPPILELKDETITVGDKFEVRELIVKAEDSAGKDIRNTIELVDDNGFNKNMVGKYVISFKLTDEKGLSVTKQATVTVNPKSASINSVPILDVKDVTVKQGEELDLISLVISAYDKEDGDIKDKVEIIDSGFNKNLVGSYTIIYKVTDKDGASIKKSARIVVISNDKQKQDKQDKQQTSIKPNKGNGDFTKSEKKDISKTTIKQTRLPKTGDSTNLFYYISMLVLSGGLILVIKLRKNKMKN